MSTGSLIRNFSKDDRELRYANSGSIRLTDVEHNAYRLSLTLEITNIDAPRYGNKKTLPDNTHYGYLTYFKGTTVTDSKAVKFPKFRVFDIINQGIWNYHQSTETTQLLAGTTQSTAEASTNFIQDKVSGWLDTILGSSFCSVVQFLDNVPDSWDTQADYSWLLNVAGCEDSSEGKLALASDYRGFPVASPFPTVVKFKSDVPASFLWRLEAWYLANPGTYIENSPTDSDDQTDDEDEYPDPEQGDGDGAGDEFPASSYPDPGSDERDYKGSGAEYPEGTTMDITWTKKAYAPGCVRVDETFTTRVGYFGSKDVALRILTSVNSCDGPGTRAGIVLDIPGAASVTLVSAGEAQYAEPVLVGVQIVLPK